MVIYGYIPRFLGIYHSKHAYGKYQAKDLLVWTMFNSYVTFQVCVYILSRCYIECDMDLSGFCLPEGTLKYLQGQPTDVIFRWSPPVVIRIASVVKAAALLGRGVPPESAERQGR